MKFWLLVPLDVKAGETVRDLLAPYTGESNRLDGWRPSTFWVKGAATESKQRAEWDDEARADYRAFATRSGALVEDLIALGATDDNLREVYDIREGESEQDYVERKRLVPEAVLVDGDWIERDHPAEDDDSWRRRFFDVYQRVPDGRLCVWVFCHR